MFDDLADLYQQLILDHNQSPRNFLMLPDADCRAHGINPNCGDNYTLYAKVDGDVVKEISFQGSGCAISKASASLLTVSLKGKTKVEMKTLFDKVHDMILTGNIDGDVGSLAALAGVHKFPERTKCAILPWHAAMAAVEGRGETVSTETEKE
jgi:nitrogen fixation protein NifU and related proteins